METKHVISRISGFTLLEVMVSVAVLTLVMGMLFTLTLSLSEAAGTQEVKVSTQDDVRLAAQALIRELRNADSTSINWAGLPSATLTYRNAIDADGNGYAVDVNGNLELSGPRTLGRDTNDANGDGRTLTQLVLTQTTGGNTSTQVIANDLLLNEDGNGNGILDAGEDLNFNNQLDRGLWFQQVGSGIQITVQTQRRGSVRSHWVPSSVSRIVVPRN